MSLSATILDHARYFRPGGDDQRFQPGHLDRELAPAVGDLIQRRVRRSANGDGLRRRCIRCGCGPVGCAIAGPYLHRSLTRAGADDADPACNSITADSQAGIGRGRTEQRDRHGCIGLPAPVARRSRAMLPFAGLRRSGRDRLGRRGSRGWPGRGRRRWIALARRRSDAGTKQDEEGRGEGKVCGKAHRPPMPAPCERLNRKRMSGEGARAGWAASRLAVADIDTTHPNR